jgi:carboxyl-terminal processing protease
MSRIRTSAVVVMLSLSVVAGVLLLSDGVPGKPVRVNTSRLLAEVMQRLEHGYIDSTSSAGLYDMAMRGMLRQLGDPHATYLDSTRLSQLRQREAGTLSGVGAELDERDGFIVVVAPYTGSSASAIGIRSGDRITLVDGRAVHGTSAEEVRLALQGLVGTSVSLGIERAGQSGTMQFTVPRDSASYAPLQEAFMLTSDIAYVRIDRFSATTSYALAGAVDVLAARRPATLLVDLRGNPGGMIEDGAAVADLFLPEGSRIASARGRNQAYVQDFIDETPARWSGMKLVVLVDEGSASASEVVAGALQDLDRALIVGRPTYGKGSRQELIALTAHDALLLTTARWYTPLGRSIDAASDAPRPRANRSGGAGDAERPEYQTASGRTLVGGGGIRPDVIVQKDVVVSADSALARESYGPANAARIVASDADVRAAVTIASQASGQMDLLERAAMVDSSDMDPELR